MGTSVSPGPAGTAREIIEARARAVNEVEVYILSEQALADVIDQIEGIRWQELSPGWFQTGRAGTTSLREIVKYHAYDTAWVPDVLAGRTIEAVGTAHDGDLLGEHPGASYRRLSELAIAAARALEDPDRTVHLSYATSRLASTSSTSAPGAPSGPTTSPAGSAPTPPCLRRWSWGCGTRCSRRSRAGGRWASFHRPSRCRRTHRSRTGCSAWPGATRPSPADHVPASPADQP